VRNSTWLTEDVARRSLEPMVGAVIRAARAGHFHCAGNRFLFRLLAALQELGLRDFKIRGNWLSSSAWTSLIMEDLPTPQAPAIPMEIGLAFA
jgi:hypothetical protein